MGQVVRRIPVSLPYHTLQWHDIDMGNIETESLALHILNVAACTEIDLGGDLERSHAYQAFYHSVGLAQNLCANKVKLDSAIKLASEYMDAAFTDACKRTIHGGVCRFAHDSFKQRDKIRIALYGH